MLQLYYVVDIVAKLSFFALYLVVSLLTNTIYGNNIVVSNLNGEARGRRMLCMA